MDQFYFGTIGILGLLLIIGAIVLFILLRQNKYLKGILFELSCLRSPGLWDNCKTCNFVDMGYGGQYPI